VILEIRAMQSGENMEMLAQRKPNFWIAFGIKLDQLTIIVLGKESYPLSSHIRGP